MKKKRKRRVQRRLRNLPPNDAPPFPPPHKLIAMDKPVRVTLFLNKSCISFFKRAARKNGTKYQKLIREVLCRYANHYTR